MSMYYQSSSASEVEADDDGGLPTLYLMNPNYVDTTQPNTMLFAGNIPVLSHGHNYMSTTWGLVDHQSHQTPRRHLSLGLSAHHQSGDRDLPTESPSINGLNTMKSVIMGSKYLKAAQELLDQVLNVDADKTRWPEKAKKVKEADKGGGGGGGANISLTSAQRQEIQTKKAKLNSMLDEVEQRCKQYQEQMQIVVASFEHAAGFGSAKPYTQVALKTILNQFGCLKSTISAQIKGLNKRLGEEDQRSDCKGTSRHKFVDHQRAALMHNNAAWRPQRGLPERAVSVLRAWLFEHFLHPYPKDSDKQMLAKQTGLTRGQVSNWFINARVRLWKPMVEEMYIEETKNNQCKIPIDNKAATTTAPPPPPPPSRTNFAQLISSLNMPEKSPKKARNEVASFLSADETAMKRFSNNNNVVKFMSTHENYLSMENMNRYGADQQVAAGNGFSLSLALPPTDQFSHRNLEFVNGGGIDEGGSSHLNIGYDRVLNFQSRKAFPPQLLPDFVA